LTVGAFQGRLDVAEKRLAADGTSHLHLSGWALLPGEGTARVEILVDGRVVGRARLGHPTPEVAAVSTRPAAALCGFEYDLAPGDLPPGAERVTLTARVVGTRGTIRSPDDVPVPVDPPVRDVATDPTQEDDARRLPERLEAVIATKSRPASYPLRVLVFTHSLAYGGAQLYLLELLRDLMGRSAADCTVVSFGDGPLRDAHQSFGMPVHISCMERRQSIPSYEGRLHELAAWAAPQGFNAVIANTLDGFIGVDLARRLEIPAVWAIHESYDPAEWWASAYGQPANAYLWARMRDAISGAAAVIFEAESTRQQFLPYGSPDRLIALPYGIMVDEIAAYRQRVDRRQARRWLDIDQEATVILCLGTIEPRKGQTALAMAFAALADSYPTAVLALVGETDVEWLGPGNDALREFTDRANLGSRVMIAPVTPTPYEWLAAADVLVLASDVESLPRVILEGMAFELPIVATSIFGVTEIIDDGRNGYLCRPRDVGALTAVLDRALGDGAERRRAIARAGAEHVRGQHDARRYAAVIATMLQALAADPGALPMSVCEA
jgi:glycosyltransferase involved in cell wall biosynthesis